MKLINEINNAFKMAHKVLSVVFFTLIFFLPSLSYAISDPFPYTSKAPSLDNLLSSPVAVRYCSTSGDNITGDGSIDNPWYDLRGANGNLGAGYILYFRGGTYVHPASKWSLSENRMYDAGYANHPIIITNYPGEQVVYNDTDGWSMTLSGTYQYLIGTMVGSEYGIKITGGITVTKANIRVSGVEFIKGADNGGDLNPAMISYPYNGDTIVNLHISHNYFHDSENIGASNIMAPIRLFNVTNPVIEFNLFKNCNETAGGGCVFHKDVIYGTSNIRFNKFISCESAVTFGHQGEHHDSINIYGNLFYDVDRPIENRHYMGTESSSSYRFFNNVALNCRTGFYYYQNHGNGNYTDRGWIYNNVIDGVAIRQGYGTYSNDPKNLPDIYDYNLWFSESDRTVMRARSDGTLSLNISGESYFDHSVTSSASVVTYDATNMAAIASDTFPGRTSGLDNDCIGGFAWDGNVYIPPVPTSDDDTDISVSEPIPTPTLNPTSPTGLRITD